MDMLSVSGLTKKYAGRRLFEKKRTVTASDNVTFSVKKGEVFVIAGESGSGKSTIARLVMGSDLPDSGEVVFEGTRVKYDRAGMRNIRMQCQMIQQDPYDSINPRMTVGSIIEEPLEIHGFGDRQARIDRTHEVLREVKLKPQETVHKYPHMLSGGQRQRVVLARALALKPKMIIADEPVSMLDVSIRAEILELMNGLREMHGITFLYITHDLATARFFGTNIAIIYKGGIVEMGPVDRVLLEPRHPYTRALLDAISRPDPANRHRQKKIGIINAGKSEQGGCRFRSRCPHAVSECRKEPALLEKHGRKVACFVDI